MTLRKETSRGLSINESKEFHSISGRAQQQLETQNFSAVEKSASKNSWAAATAHLDVSDCSSRL